MMNGHQRDSTCAIQPADLDESALASIRGLEAQLGEGVCLLAVKKQPLFVLEAKTAPNQWQCIREVYPQTDLAPYYCDKEESKLAKSALKSLLLGIWKQRFKKYPIRIREIC